MVSCNETVIEPQICTLVSGYDDGVPDDLSGKRTMVKSSVTLYSLGELNEEQKSITLNVLLAMVWDDTRISLIPKGNTM